MGFHLGKPIAVMIGLAVAAGLVSRFTTSAAGRTDLELWTFADNRHREFTGVGNKPGEASPIQMFERETGLTAAVKLIQYRALNTRMSTLILGDVRGPEVPDVTEIEIGTVGRFFAAPTDQVGFLPLDDLIAKHGWSGKFVQNRLTTWSRGGKIFGVPCDIHPVMLAYNDALFREAGIDLSTSATWEQLIDNCLAAQKVWRERGVTERWSLELPQNGPSVLVTMLLQRGVSLIDASGELRLTDPRVLDTLVTYCRMFVGPRRIGMQPSEGNQAYAQDMNDERMAAMLAPDWRVQYIRDYGPNLAGKMKVMPLPRWPDSPCRTSTFGGTAAAIPRNAADPEKSWKLIEAMYLNPRALMIKTSYTLPAAKSLWAQDPRRDEYDTFYSGQQVRRLIAELADEVPARNVSPSSSYAETALAQVLVEAISRLRDNGGTEGDETFRAYCAGQLKQADRLVRARIEHGEPMR